MRFLALAVSAALIFIAGSVVYTNAEARANAIMTVALPLPDSEVQARSQHLAVTSVEELECLAANVYHEARDQGREGMLAVAFVTLNRVESEYWPDSVCEVVYEGHTRRDRRCQFSWTCDGKSDEPRERAAWYASLDIAREVLSGEVSDDITHNAVFYHANYVSPSWSKSARKVRVAVVGDHIFYRYNWMDAAIASN